MSERSQSSASFAGLDALGAVQIALPPPHSMNKLISLILLAGGIALIIYGINASNSIGSDFSRLFTGSPTDKSIWLLVGGVVAAIVGAGGLFRGSRVR
ncbi:MAG: rane protein [Verrucomicrobia bacterium]|nr:rane protein [Verrucomicrobiota bacterium]